MLTLYVPAVVTLMEEVIAPVLHNRLPVEVVDKVDVPLQLLITVITGVAGVVCGAALFEPALLVHPLNEAVTEYAPADVTDMEEVVPPLLHNNVPLAVVDKLDVPSQLLTTVTTGVAGVVLGDASTVATGLIHPLAVCCVAE